MGLKAEGSIKLSDLGEQPYLNADIHLNVTWTAELDSSDVWLKWGTARALSPAHDSSECG